MSHLSKEPEHVAQSAEQFKQELDVLSKKVPAGHDEALTHLPAIIREPLGQVVQLSADPLHEAQDESHAMIGISARSGSRLKQLTLTLSSRVIRNQAKLAIWARIHACLVE